MHFSLSNAPDTFHRTMDVTLFSVKWQRALVDLDDVVVFSKKPSKNTDHVISVLALQRDGGIALELEKCEFFTRYINDMGQVVRLGCSETISYRSAAIRGLMPPTTVTELKSFLHYAKYFITSSPTLPDQWSLSTKRSKKTNQQGSNY